MVRGAVWGGLVSAVKFPVSGIKQGKCRPVALFSREGGSSWPGYTVACTGNSLFGLSREFGAVLQGNGLFQQRGLKHQAGLSRPRKMLAEAEGWGACVSRGFDSSVADEQHRKGVPPMNTTGVSGKRRGRPPLPAIDLVTYVADRLNAGDSMKDVAKDSFIVIGIDSPKPGTLEYEVSQEVAGRNIAARYREMRKQMMAPWAEPGHAVPLFMGRPMKMPASVTETVERKRGRPRKKPPVT